MGPKTIVISLQNGVEKDSILQKMCPPTCVMGGTTFISATISKPGTIHYLSKMQKILFGELDGKRSERGKIY